MAHFEGHIVAIDSDAESGMNSVNAVFVGNYSIRQPILTEHAGIYCLLVESCCESIFSLRPFISKTSEIRFSIGAVKQLHHALHALRPVISCEHSGIYDIEMLFAISESQYSIVSECEYVHHASYMLANTITAAFLAKHNLLDRNPINKTHVAPYVIELPAEHITNTLTAEVSGINVNLFDVQIESDDDSFCMSFSAQVADIESWLACIPGSNINITVNSTVFAFILDERSRSRRFGSEEYNVSGRSPASNLAVGKAQPITKTWGATTAKEVAAELCGACGVGFDYQLTDWAIPAGALVSDGEYPVDVIKKIANAAGGILQSSPGGVLVLKPKYPASPVLYETLTPALTISDVNDIFSISESREIKPKYNAVYVMDYQDSSDTAYSIEQIDVDAAAGAITLAVWAYPFKNSMDLKTSYAEAGLSIESMGIVKEEKTEVIEIVAGTGSVSRPVLSVVSHLYKHSADLGDITASNTAVSTATKGQSLLEITYTTQYHKFIITNSDKNASQLYTEEEAA